MGGPYLESGESIVLTADRISVDNITYDALLTTRRLILTDMRYARFEPRTLSLAAIESVRSGKAATGEPVILLSLKSDGNNPPDQRVLVFLQDPLESRRIDRDLWVRKFIELSISDHEPVAGTYLPPVEPKEGMQPSVRRWVAPEIVRPRPDMFGKNEPSKRIVVMEEDLPRVPEPVQVEIVPARSDDTTPSTSRPEQDVEEAVTPGPENEPVQPAPADDGSGPEKADDNYLSRSILAATQSLIAAKAREELTRPPQKSRVRTTTVLSENLQKSLPEPPADHPAPPAEPAVAIRTTSPVPALFPEPEPVVVESSEPDAGTPPASEAPAAVPSAIPLREEKAVSVKEPQRPAEPASPAAPATLAGANPLHILVGIIACLLVLVGVFVLLHGIPQQDPGRTTIPDVITPLPTVPVVTAVTTTAPVVDDLSGIRVRVSSTGFYTGEAGNPGFVQPVSGPGDVLVRPLYADRPVLVRVEKEGNGGEERTVASLKDGRALATRSTSAPRGSVELFIDPLTGKPPGLVTTVPTTDAARVGSGKLEYY